MAIKANNRPTPFANDEPGKNDLALFFKRRPDIANRNAKIISKARAAVTEESIHSWFDDLIKHLEEEKCISDRNRIFNVMKQAVLPTNGKTVRSLEIQRFLYDKRWPRKRKHDSTVLLRIWSNHFTYACFSLQKAFIPDSYFVGRSDSDWMYLGLFHECS
ncbi:hypothetical protein JTB14_004865 [Gonioctena quinquepunctata]|nr:hypothetical protein JTB14_004865 [Gonioctena quinquepunctata]